MARCNVVASQGNRAIERSWNSGFDNRVTAFARPKECRRAGRTVSSHPLSPINPHPDALPPPSRQSCPADRKKCFADRIRSSSRPRYCPGQTVVRIQLVLSSVRVQVFAPLVSLFFWICSTSSFDTVAFGYLSTTVASGIAISYLVTLMIESVHCFLFAAVISSSPIQAVMTFLAAAAFPLKRISLASRAFTSCCI